MIAIEFFKHMYRKRLSFTIAVFVIGIFGLFLESGLTWRFWAILLTFALFLVVEFTTWYMQTHKKDQPHGPPYH